LLFRVFPDFDRLEILGKDALAASFVVAGKTPIRTNPAIAALPILAALESVDLVEAVCPFGRMASAPNKTCADAILPKTSEVFCQDIFHSASLI